MCSQSLTPTLDGLNGSHSTATLLYDLLASESATLDEKCEKDQINLHADSPVCEHSTTHSLGAEEFLKQKLELLQAKLHSALAESKTDGIPTNALIQASTSGCIKESDTQENPYIVACLCRLRGGHAACITEHSSASYGTQKRVHGNAEVFSRQCEILRTESLKNRMKEDIKVGCMHTQCHTNLVCLYGILLFFPLHAESSQ